MKGIMFTEGNFRAVVDGHKTQTRRIMRPQPLEGLIEPGANLCYTIGLPSQSGLTYYYPKYKVGEILYLKEPYLRIGAPEGHKAEFDYLYGKEEETREKIQSLPDLKHARTMPARAARYFIEITGVWAEQVQDISEEDCMREGVQPSGHNDCKGNDLYIYNGCKTEFYSARAAFASLIDKVSGRGTWALNPWVVVYEFKLIG